jgi:hypothetical protein
MEPASSFGEMKGNLNGGNLRNTLTILECDAS